MFSKDSRMAVFFICPIKRHGIKTGRNYPLSWIKLTDAPHRQARKGKRMKLEELLGEELYKQVQAKLDEVNGKEPDKMKHVRYADLSEGNYVGKMKYDTDIEKLNHIISGKDTELETANGLIAELKKGTKGDEEMQGKIAGYETQVAALQKQLQETKIASAVKVALLSEKAADVDYLAYKLNEKLKEKGETLELDENDNIKGWNDILSGLKAQFPTMFETAGNDVKNILENKLPNGEPDRTAEPKSLEEALRQEYENN